MKRNVRFFAISGMLTALVTLSTLISVPVGTFGAYLNAGDSMVYVAAYVIGGPWCFVVAGLGSLFADAIFSAWLYAPATFIIKGVMALVMALLINKLTKYKNTLSVPIAGLVMPLGYFAYELVLSAFNFWSSGVAVTNLLFNLLQYAAGCILGIVLIQTIDRLRIKDKLK